MTQKDFKLLFDIMQHYPEALVRNVEKWQDACIYIDNFQTS
jgi:hypothetical protein